MPSKNVMKILNTTFYLWVADPKKREDVCRAISGSHVRDLTCLDKAQRNFVVCPSERKLRDFLKSPNIASFGEIKIFVNEGVGIREEVLHASA